MPTNILGTESEQISADENPEQEGIQQMEDGRIFTPKVIIATITTIGLIIIAFFQFGPQWFAPATLEPPAVGSADGETEKMLAEGVVDIAKDAVGGLIGDEPTPAPTAIPTILEWGSGYWQPSDAMNNTIRGTPNGPTLTVSGLLKEKGESNIYEYTFQQSADWSSYSQCDLSISYVPNVGGAPELNYSIVTGSDWDWWTVKREVLLNPNSKIISMRLLEADWRSDTLPGDYVQGLDKVIGIAFFFENDSSGEFTIHDVICW